MGRIAAVDCSSSCAFGTGYRQSSRSSSSDSLTSLLPNATSHVDRPGHGCRSAPAMQYSGGVDMTGAIHRQPRSPA